MARQRLTFASVWAFEDLGVKEIQTRLKDTSLHADLVCEYEKRGDVLVISGNADSPASVVSVIADYIEEQSHKDLLEVPRIRQIEVPVAVVGDANQALMGPEEQQEELVSLDDGIDANVISLPLDVVTKTWACPTGGLGCFATDFQDILAAIESFTGTKISVVDDIVGIKVSGGSEADVNDALAKLTQVERPLSCIIKPTVVNMVIANCDHGLRLQSYASLCKGALRRILPGQNLSAISDFGQVCVTVSLFFDQKGQVLGLPDNLLYPSKVTEQPKASRIWNDFRFQEIGNGDDYVALESIVENDSHRHPYLSADKVEEVSQWVARADSASASQDADTPTISNPEPTPVDPRPPVERSRPAGIKARRPVPSGQEAPNKTAPERRVVPLDNQVSDRNGRQIWRMTYTPDPAASASEKEIPQENPAALASEGMPQGSGSSALNDLLGLILGDDPEHAMSSSPEATLASEQKSTSGSEQGRKLACLREAYARREHEVLRDTSVTTRALPHTRGLANQVFAQQRIEDFERQRTHDHRQEVDEIATRTFHTTMSQQAGKTKAKKAIAAKRQKTLEEAWGASKNISKKPTGDTPKSSLPAEQSESATSKKAKPNGQAAQDTQAEASHADIKELFETIRPVLEIAECFPGTLSLEVQIGLLLIPVLPKTCPQDVILMDAWTKIFRPRGGVSAPTTKFINRVTATGSDVDHIVDLKTSRDQEKRRLFEQNYSEYNVTYEFHCSTKACKPLVIVVEEDGKHSIKKDSPTLGAVHLHFPGQVWDARVALSGSIESTADVPPEVEESAQYLVDHIWVQPERSVLHIFTKLPAEKQITIEKVLMKRWTRHRYIRPDESTSKGVSTAMAPRRTSSASDWGSTSSLSSTSDGQDIFLQITETQDLIIGTTLHDRQAVRARCDAVRDMGKSGRMWYEVSLSLRRWTVLGIGIRDWQSKP
ncbi:predicted protein [Aspergillus terreus NIH2624]|uniref:Uncharacterized protein n=1 Tax=Aspergillus terreus (strain NIH 2624 / FGSC A1156) TaxID=341663 RepID=Q0CNG1_ASPTN|nr:uncharacterized protein ATEG_04773 [Aspergillus terreus NIH2624]EAU35220.1 predicted protein [Aspergillus terreus NIH2624]